MSKESKVELLKDICKSHGILYVEMAYQKSTHEEFIKGSPEQVLTVMKEFNNLLNNTE